MGVYIKGMEMPKNCMECPFSDHEAWCLIPGDSKKRYYCPTKVISEHCPLIEVPENHSRLIDADALEPDADYDDGEFWAYSVTQVCSAQAIVEKEDGT